MLESLAMENARTKHPGMPYLAPRTYRDDTANGLTKCIIDFLRLRGHQAERISCTGRYIDNSKVVTDCLGFKRRIGSGRWIPGSMQRGTADISATILGLSVKVEVKIAKDGQSDKQREYQIQVEQSSGIYIIANSFQHFLDQYYNIVLI